MPPPVDNPFDFQRRLIFGPDGEPTTFLDYIPCSTYDKPHDPWGPLPRKPDAHVEMLVDLGKEVARIDGGALKAPLAEITNVRVAGGYRWLKSDTPRISVPGVPDLLKVDAQIGQIPTDRHIKDAVDNADYTGTILLSHRLSPLEPIFHSLTHPHILSKLDIIVDRSVLSRLMRLCGVDSIYDDQDAFPFRIDAERVGNTVILHRWESAGDRWKTRPHVATSKTYHRAATLPTTEGADVNAACTRMVRYDFGGLAMLVTFDVGAVTHLPDEMSEDEDLMDGAGAGAGASASESSSVSAASDAPTAFPPARGSNKTIHAPCGLPNLSVVPSGYAHPSQSSLALIKTRSYSKELDMGHIFGQLFFSQTPWIVVGKHRMFDYSVVPQRIGNLHDEAFAPVRAQYQGNVDRVAVVLREMVARVRVCSRARGDVNVNGAGDVSFLCTKQGRIDMYKREGKGTVVPLSEEARIMLERAADV